GTSYQANGWIWSVIGRKVGYGGFSHPVIVIRSNRDVYAEQPSEFALTGDIGTFTVSRFPRTGTWRLAMPYGMWHGEDVCNMAFLDGSARSIKMTPGGFGAGYSVWFEKNKHLPTCKLHPTSTMYTHPGYEDDESESQ